jgi:hypothetical protein
MDVFLIIHTHPVFFRPIRVDDEGRKLRFLAIVRVSLAW